MDSIEKVGQDTICGNLLGFYRPVYKDIPFEICVVNLTSPKRMGKRRCVRAYVQKLGLSYTVELLYFFKRVELNRVDKTEAEAQCMADLIQIGLGGPTSGLQWQHLVRSCMANAERAKELW